MQNSSTIKELGFLPTSNSNEFIWRGRYQRFIAKPYDYETPQYVSIFLVSKTKDTREYSTKKGHYLKTHIKDCTSEKSLEKVLANYDLPDVMLNIDYMGVTIKAKALALKYKYKALAQKQELELLK